jgi:hypothetical protein
LKHPSGRTMCCLRAWVHRKCSMCIHFILTIGFDNCRDQDEAIVLAPGGTAEALYSQPGKGHTNACIEVKDLSG